MLTTYFDTTSSVTSQYGIAVAHSQSFQAGRQQKLLIFVPNTVKIFKYRDTTFFSKYNFVILQ